MRQYKMCVKVVGNEPDLYLMLLFTYVQTIFTSSANIISTAKLIMITQGVNERRNRKWRHILVLYLNDNIQFKI